jgi:hypothetical protein
VDACDAKVAAGLAGDGLAVLEDSWLRAPR